MCLAFKRDGCVPRPVEPSIHDVHHYYAMRQSAVKGQPFDQGFQTAGIEYLCVSLGVYSVPGDRRPIERSIDESRYRHKPTLASMLLAT
jgi:hypothetical protein